MSSVPIQIVDNKDNPIGSAPKEQAWAEGLVHRIVRIMLEDEQGNILLQHRDPSKSLFPDCWDNSTAGHVDADEEYEAAAHRELQEELGITNVALHEVGTYYDDSEWRGRKLYNFNKVYTARISSTASIVLEAGKVDAVQWFTKEEAKRLAAEKPENCTIGLVQVLTKFY